MKRFFNSFPFAERPLASCLVGVVFFIAAMAGPAAHAQAGFPVLSNQHVDMLITYDPSSTPPLAFLARNNDVTPNASYVSNEVVIVATEASQFTMPGDFPALGLVNGQKFWWLRQSQPPPGTLYLGFNGGGVPSGLFTGNTLRVYLVECDGPGGFFLWQDQTFGGVQVLMDSRNGLDASDKVPVLTSGHDHYNWAFTSNGVYSLTFRVEGTLAADNSTVSSLETTFVFHVLPLGVVTPYARWQKAHWLQGTPETISGPGADPDNDGLINAIEYASQLDPNTFTASNRPSFSFVTDGSDTFGAWTFRRLKSAPDLTYDPAGADSLSAPLWEPMTSTVSVLDEGEMETVTLRDHRSTATLTNRFWNYRVWLAEP